MRTRRPSHPPPALATPLCAARAGARGSTRSPRPGRSRSRTATPAADATAGPAGRRSRARPRAPPGATRRRRARRPSPRPSRRRRPRGASWETPRLSRWALAASDGVSERGLRGGLRGLRGVGRFGLRLRLCRGVGPGRQPRRAREARRPARKIAGCPRRIHGRPALAAVGARRQEQGGGKHHRGHSGSMPAHPVPPTPEAGRLCSGLSSPVKGDAFPGRPRSPAAGARGHHRCRDAHARSLRWSGPPVHAGPETIPTRTECQRTPLPLATGRVHRGRVRRGLHPGRRRLRRHGDGVERLRGTRGGRGRTYGRDRGRRRGQARGRREAGDPEGHRPQHQVRAQVGPRRRHRPRRHLPALDPGQRGGPGCRRRRDRQGTSAAPPQRARRRGRGARSHRATPGSSRSCPIPAWWRSARRSRWPTPSSRAQWIASLPATSRPQPRKPKPRTTRSRPPRSDDSPTRSRLELVGAGAGCAARSTCRTRRRHRPPAGGGDGDRGRAGGQRSPGSPAPWPDPGRHGGGRGGGVAARRRPARPVAAPRGGGHPRPRPAGRPRQRRRGHRSCWR